MLGLSTEDYVLRSVGPVFMILLGVGVVGLLGLGLERLITHFVRRLVEDRRRRRLGVLAVVLIFALGAALPALVLGLRPVWRLGSYAVFPASLGAGLLVCLYASHLLRPRGSRTRPRSMSTLSYVFVGLLVLLAVFWTAGRIAEVQGTDAADEIVYGLTSRPGVVVTSDVPLHLEGPGIETIELEQPGGTDGAEVQTRYRYRGLRLLAYGGGRLFVVHEGWPWEDGTVTVLDDDDPSLRFHFVRDLENEALRPS